jgi:hypothetical protein
VVGIGEYNRDQWEALMMVEHCLEGLPACKSEEDLSLLKAALAKDPCGFKCVYLKEKGCLRRVKAQRDQTCSKSTGTSSTHLP